MARGVVALAVLALVVSAGCLTVQPVRTDPIEPTETTTEAPFEVPDRTVDRETSPWGPGPVTVAVDDRVGWELDVRPELRETLAFWEHAVYPGGRYRPEFEVVENASDADVRVEVVAAVERCRVHEDDVALGCAPVVPTNATVTDSATVQVRAGHAPGTTKRILKHEFGHVLGFRHGEGPQKVMARNLSARAPDDVADGADRTYPWASTTLQVAVDAEDGAAAAREQVRAAAAYYERGANDTVANPPTVEVVEDAADADVVVSLRESVDCDVYGAATSCADWDGPDVDDDGAPEYFTDGRVVVAADGHDRAGWHLGYWLGRTLWTNGVPAPFRTSDHPRAETW